MKSLVFLVCLLFFAFPSLEGKPVVSCCTERAKSIPRNMFKLVKEVYFQPSDGICDLQAVVLILEKQKKCLHPKNKDFRKWLKWRGLTPGQTLNLK
uniref:C-C motif chemokine 27 n=1 Tax=Geotrypetes seraphini TaxID=260995 RepID=A0A6P8P7D0_GEOSA|nr:C-C motif chemokine 27 [Geotrypetes seraphini]